jgi:NADPH:quinone reductase-like Zn-dependent oxidoreductase
VQWQPPQVGDSEVLVRVKVRDCLRFALTPQACAISDLDIAVRKGTLKDVGATAPLCPGYEISGVILAVCFEVSF